jgi:hypothetical protein
MRGAVTVIGQIELQSAIGAISVADWIGGRSLILAEMLARRCHDPRCLDFTTTNGNIGTSHWIENVVIICENGIEETRGICFVDCIVLNLVLTYPSISSIAR